MATLNKKTFLTAVGIFFLVLFYFVFGSGWYVPAKLIIKGTAPQSGAEIEVSWDSGGGWNTYEQEVFKVESKPEGYPGEIYTIRIQATGEKHVGSQSETVVCSRIRIDGREIELKGLRAAEGRLGKEGIHLSGPDDEIRIDIPVKENIHVELLTNPHSGIARLTIDGHATERDLYMANIEAKRIGVDRWVLQPNGAFVLTMEMPRYDVRTLQIRNRDPARPAHLQSVVLQSSKGATPLGAGGKQPLESLKFHGVSIGLKQYFEPVQFIYQLIFASFTTWILMTVFNLVSSRGGVTAILLEKQRYIFWLLFMGAVSIYTIWLVAFWPGILSVDSLKVWRAAILPEVYLNDHPLLFVFLYKYLRHVWDNVAVVSFFHITLTSMLISHVVFSLYRERISLFWLLPIYLAAIFSVPLCLYNIVLWKDIPFALLVVFWAYVLAKMYRQKRNEQLKLSLEQVVALFFLYLALGLIRHNGIIYLAVVPLFLVALRIVSIKYMVILVVGIAAVATVLFMGLVSKNVVDDAGYLLDKGAVIAEPILKRSVIKESIRFGKEYWGFLDINQTRSKWDLWHYYLKDREAYWFLRHSGWKDVYPYLPEKQSLFPALKNLGMKIYWKSYKAPWVYLSWNPVFMLTFFPLFILLYRWLPMSAIFSAFILIQVIALLGVINILNWRYYYFVCLGGYFLPLVVLWDCRYLYLSSSVEET